MVPKGTRRMMILLLMVMTPGIPEYMTGSSKLSSLLYDPSSFFLGLGFNIALYSAGALLIREFAIKYNKGWASILILGLAYGIMEEGISVHTFFISSGNPVGVLAVYGRYLGVDWIWALGISFFHSIFSIGLPLLLLSIAYPRYSREPLLGRRGSFSVLAIYVLDVIVLNIVVNGIRTDSIPSAGLYIFFMLLSIILVVAARLVPGKWLSGKGDPEKGTRKLFFLGLITFPLYFLNSFFPNLPVIGGRIPPIIDAPLYILANILVMWAILRNMPPTDNRRHKFSLAIGLIIPLFVWAEAVQILGIARIITVVSIIAVILLLKLRKWVRTGLPEYAY